MRKELEKFEEVEQQVMMPEGEEGIKRQHALGKLTARERLDLLFDKGTFTELMKYAQHECYDFGMEKRRPWGDALITGSGKVDGRTVYAFAQDFSVWGGSLGATSIEKMCRLIILARNVLAPVVGLWDSVGGRVQEGTAHGCHHFFAETVYSSGIIPQISAVMGNCAGGAVYSPALTDFILMVKETSQMFITGPRVIKEVTGAEITAEELGGWKPQSEKSGVCDFVAKDDEECIQMVRKLLSYLPLNYLEKLPLIDTGDDPNRCDKSLLDVVPENPKKPYDMHGIILKVVDNGDFMEVKPRFAMNIITGFARLGGQPVGIVASQPFVKSGALTCDASDKAARFYRTCDCFNIPLVCFIDVPGYMPGIDEEYKGIIRHGAKMLYGFAEATVPKITCVIHKAYGGSYAATGAKTMGADIVFAWPTAEIALMGAEGAVSVIYKEEIEAAEDKEQFRKEKIEEYRDKYSGPYWAGSKMMVDEIIRPEETRPKLIKALKMLENKIEERPRGKHGNIPL